MSTNKIDANNANIGNLANEVTGNARQQANQHNYAAQPNLAETIKDLKAIFTELDQSYNKTTPTGQAMIYAKTIEAIEGNSTIKKRLINAVKEGGAAAIEEIIDHPVVKPLIAFTKGFIEAE